MLIWCTYISAKTETCIEPDATAVTSKRWLLTYLTTMQRSARMRLARVIGRQHGL